MCFIFLYPVEIASEEICALPKFRFIPLAKNNSFIFHSLPETMLFESFGGASDFVLEFPKWDISIPVFFFFFFFFFFFCVCVCVCVCVFGCNPLFGPQYLICQRSAWGAPYFCG